MLTHALRRDHKISVNKKKIHRICVGNSLLLPRRKPKRLSPWLLSVNRVITKKNELWEFDVKYGYVHGEQKFFFVLALVAVFTRKCVGAFVGLSCKAADLVFTLSRALQNEGVTASDQLAIRSDNGPQMTSHPFAQFLDKLAPKLSHEFIPLKTLDKNALVESFFSILELEFLRVRFFNRFAESYEQTHKFIHFCNNTRMHGSLHFRTPQEVCELLKQNIVCNIQEVRC